MFFQKNAILIAPNFATHCGVRADEERALARLSRSALIAWLLVYLIILLIRGALLICSIAPRSGAIAANHRRQKVERSGAFWRPSEFALLAMFSMTYRRGQLPISLE